MSKPPELVGLYQKQGKKTWRFRWTDRDGVRHSVSTGKRELSEAIEVAKKLRGTTPSSAKKSAWNVAVNRYIADKLAGKRPAHLGGRRLHKFRKGAVVRVKSCLKVFAERNKITRPGDVTIRHLQKYYEKRAKNSEAGARSTIATIQAFLDHVGCLRERVRFDADTKPEPRQATISMEMANDWIRSCKRDDLKFVLYCGLHCGMRKGEIMHSRPSWFDLSASPPIVKIPGREIQNLRTGKHEWRTKDGESRRVPLSEDFADFLRSYLPDCKKHCLASKISKDGLFDFRVPYERFVKDKEREDMTIHAMRHSWISSLCNSGHASITQIAAWSGDSIETIQNSYWKKRVAPEALADTVAGKKVGQDTQDIKELAQQTQRLLESMRSDISGQKPYEEWSEEKKREFHEWATDFEYFSKR